MWKCQMEYYYFSEWKIFFYKFNFNFKFELNLIQIKFKSINKSIIEFILIIVVC